uniref:threonine ammonia-lyase n=1 Tax=Elaeis guineensis var. tenera TaxID=51953 RepID=A0A6I9RB25_ELAGV|nr:threonine dehydratase 1 biosynthetic, chloroplastic-like [Elaeis guineensis]
MEGLPECNHHIAESPSKMVKIIGVEPSDANAMALSLYHGQRVMLEQVGGFVDGVAVKVVGEETFRSCRELIDGVVLVGRDAICASIKDMFEEKRSILEPAGALSLAGAEAYCKNYGLEGTNVVAIASGANMNFDRLRLVIELADRANEVLRRKNKASSPGGDLTLAVTEAVGLHIDTELGPTVERLRSAQLRTFNLTNDDMVKHHLRYFMGGQSNVQDEVLCRFIFPERPGALMKFLDAYSPRWNISLFHYRAQGETGANVLVGIQVPKEDMEEFRNKANNLGYEYAYEVTNEAYKLLMQ